MKYLEEISSGNKIRIRKYWEYPNNTATHDDMVLHV